MSKLEILVVEDEPHIARGLAFNLEQEGYRVVVAASGEEALRLLPEHSFALVVLDLMLPGLGGLEVCRRIRALDPRLPVLMLTALSSEADRVEGLRHGADDYLTKPFSLAEFLLRVEGILRRSAWYRRPVDAGQPYRFGENRVDLASGRAATPRGDVALTELELKMLRQFVAREGEVLSRAELLESVWGMSPESETRTLDNFVVRLRKYFEPDPSAPVYFLTVRGRGYRFVGKPNP